MSFFVVLGWFILVLFALGMTFALPCWVMMMSKYGDCKPGEKWLALIPFSLGCLVLYGLFTHSPFHIIVS